MTYDRLYPFGAERDDMHTANIVRQVAFGALSEPSTDIRDYLTFADYDDSEQIVAVDNIEIEQQRVVDNLDLIFG